MRYVGSLSMPTLGAAMYSTTPDLPTPADVASPWLIGWQAANGWGQLLAQAIGLQAQALAAWQQSVQATQRDLVDDWIARWGGGVPLDG